jgi:hypothetical protein
LAGEDGLIALLTGKGLQIERVSYAMP